MSSWSTLAHPFPQLRRAQGLDLRDAVIDAGAVRFRPMVLTAAAVAVGGSVILFDPIFQGPALALIGGEVAATVLSRVAVPVLYYLLRRGDEKAVADFVDGPGESGAASTPPAANGQPRLPTPTRLVEAT